MRRRDYVGDEEADRHRHAQHHQAQAVPNSSAAAQYQAMPSS
jgi:hypothetical protein